MNELQPCYYRLRTLRAPKFRHILMDATSITVLIVATMILSWYAIQAWQLDHDTHHDDDRR